MARYEWSIEPGPIIEGLGARAAAAASCLSYAVAAVESLFYLADLDSMLMTGARHLPEGHDALTVDVAHARWAAGTAVTALDLCGAAVGHLHLPAKDNRQ